MEVNSPRDTLSEQPNGWRLFSTARPNSVCQKSDLHVAPFAEWIVLPLESLRAVIPTLIKRRSPPVVEISDDG